MTITHARVSGIASTGDPNRIQGPDWDADHVLVYGVAADLVPDAIEGDAGTDPAIPHADHAHPDPLLPQLILQRWYGPGGPVTVASGFSVSPPTLNRLYAIPFEIGAPREFDRIGTATATSVATAQLVLGIYADDGGQPGALLLQTSPIDASPASSLIDAAFDQIFSGLVWLAAAAQTAVPDCAVLGIAGDAGFSYVNPRIGLVDPFGGFLGVGNGTTAAAASYQDSISGALPDPWGSTLNVDAGGAIYVLLRAK